MEKLLQADHMPWAVPVLEHQVPCPRCASLLGQREAQSLLGRGLRTISARENSRTGRTLALRVYQHSYNPANVPKVPRTKAQAPCVERPTLAKVAGFPELTSCLSLS